MSQIGSVTKYRSYLFSVAYNILGEVQEAEDIVQDGFEHFLTLPPDYVKNTKSFLTRVIANKAIDRLKERKKLQASYPGTWLPEPYITTEENPPEDLLPYGMLHLLERLNPLERAIFILREAFQHSYEELAGFCEVSQDYCRKLLSRARKKVQMPKEKPASHAQSYEALLDAFWQARENDDIQPLTQLLKEDIVLYSDGGGKKAVARVPLYGWETVAKFLAGIAKKSPVHQITHQLVKINGKPSILLSLRGKPESLIVWDVYDEQIQNLYIMRNPDKIFFR